LQASTFEEVSVVLSQKGGFQEMERGEKGIESRLNWTGVEVWILGNSETERKNERGIRDAVS
jgi:hypothetical protein